MNYKKCDEAIEEIYNKPLETKNKEVGFQDASSRHHLQQELSAEESIHRFSRKLKHDSKRFKYFVKGRIAEEEEKMRRNEQELNALKKHYNNMLVEEAELKRKFWCRYCEDEATYLSRPSPYFYCSTECEQYHQNLLGVLIEGIKSNLDLPADHSSLFP